MRFISVFDTSAATTYAPFEDEPVHDLGAVLANNARATWEFAGLATNTKRTKFDPNELSSGYRQGRLFSPPEFSVISKTYETNTSSGIECSDLPPTSLPAPLFDCT